MKKRSKILDAVHEAAKGLYSAGAIDQVTMREFDQACLSPVPPMRPDDIRRDMRREYKRADFPKGFARGRYAERFVAKSNIVRLDPEIADAFPTSEAVNEALGAVLRAAKNTRRSRRR